MLLRCRSADITGACHAASIRRIHDTSRFDVFPQPPSPPKYLSLTADSLSSFRLRYSLHTCLCRRAQTNAQDSSQPTLHCVVPRSIKVSCIKRSGTWQMPEHLTSLEQSRSCNVRRPATCSECATLAGYGYRATNLACGHDRRLLNPDRRPDGMAVLSGCVAEQFLASRGKQAIGL